MLCVCIPRAPSKRTLVRFFCTLVREFRSRWCSVMQHSHSEASAHIGSHNHGIREDTWIDSFHREDISPRLIFKSRLARHYWKRGLSTTVKCRAGCDADGGSRYARRRPRDPGRIKTQMAARITLWRGKQRSLDSLSACQTLSDAALAHLFSFPAATHLVDYLLKSPPKRIIL